MKQILALILTVILVACSALSAFAEDTQSSQPPQMSGETEGMGTPPDKPDGEMPGGPGGTPPDGVPGDGGFGGGTPPDGASGNGGFGGGTPPGGRSSSFE